VRFPSEDHPGDAGRHIDVSFLADDDWWTNVCTPECGLLPCSCSPTSTSPRAWRQLDRLTATRRQILELLNVELPWPTRVPSHGLRHLVTAPGCIRGSGRRDGRNVRPHRRGGPA
jgi:hypothetical protein